MVDWFGIVFWPVQGTTFIAITIGITFVVDKHYLYGQYYVTILNVAYLHVAH